MENTTTEEFREKLDIFPEIFGKLDVFGLWDMEITQTDSNIQFTYKEFQEGLSIRVLKLVLASPDHQETNGQIEVTQ